MSEISTYKLIKEKLQAIPPNQKGSLFEKISKRFLIEHDSANEYESKGLCILVMKGTIKTLSRFAIAMEISKLKNACI
ncbi:hypothetical protein VN0510_09650 [Helicobacter pylori]